MKKHPKNPLARFSIALCLGLVVLAPVTTARADDVRVDVVVDLTPAGKAVPKPTPDHPAYYVLVPQGDKNLGDIAVYYQDRPPPPDSKVEQMLAQALGGQGYRPATKLTPPSLILICSWGYIAPHLVRVGKGPALVVDSEEALPIVAGNNTDVQLMAHMPPWMDEVIQAERMQRYYLKVTAFDFRAWKTHHVVELWQAHISVPLWGHYLYEMMPTMIAAGVPAFGQQTVRPQMFTTEVIPAGHVVVGQPSVKDGPAAAAPPPKSP